MVFLPAAGVGLFLIAAAGFAAVYILLESAEARGFEIGEGRPLHLTERQRAGISILGAVLAFGFVLHIMVDYPEAVPVIWVLLTILGILFGILTFVLADRERSGYARYRTPPPARPSGSTYTYRVPPSRKQETRYEPPRQPPTFVVAPEAKEDYYRTLLARAYYDKALADRMIEQEKESRPSASWDELCKGAIARLDRERR